VFVGLGKDVRQSGGRAQHVLREMKERRVPADRHLDRLHRGLNQCDVVPPAGVDAAARLFEHVRTELDGDDSACRANLLLEERKTDAGSTGDV